MKQILSILFGVLATACTFLLTRLIDRQITLATARDLMALGHCSMCQREGHVGICPRCQDRCLRVIENGGRTHHPGI